jgi:general secretion pathway protein A
MYESFFGLRERPFELTPNPRFLLLTPTHSEALANLQYGMTGRKGLTLLLGEAGSGKTTLVSTALAQWQAAGHVVAYLNNPTLTRDEFIEFLTVSYGLKPEAASSKTRFLTELTSFVMARNARGQTTGLLIDEAQSLSAELLEEVRLLVNIETPTEKVFQVILAGQPELAARLNEPGLRQIKQRVALRCTLSPLDVRDAAAYVAGRIRVAGGVAAQVFTREAVMAVHDHSGGIPRVISVICDNALLAAFAAGRRPVTREMVLDVCRDFDIRQAFDGAPADVAAAIPDTDSLLVVAPRPPAAADAALRPAKPAARDANAPTKAPGGPAADPPGGGLFEQYAAATKRRFSFF